MTVNESDVTSTQKSDNLCQTDEIEVKTEEIDNSENVTSNESTHKSCEKDETKEDLLENEYLAKVLDRSRNTKFTKIVHDKRDGESKVYGLTDDLIISVDEQQCKYQSYALHDRLEDKVCSEIYELLQKWPSANSSKCRYGVDCLHTLLPEIVMKQRQRASALDKDND